MGKHTELEGEVENKRTSSLDSYKQDRCYQNELPFPCPGDLHDPGIEPRPPVLQVDSLPSAPPEKPNLDSQDR